MAAKLRQSAKSSPNPIPLNLSHGDTLDSPLLDLCFHKHQIKCPHCKKQTMHSWPGKLILFSTAECSRCAMEFLIVENETMA